MPLAIADGTFVGGRQEPLAEAMLWAIIDSASRSPKTPGLRAIHADCCRLLRSGGLPGVSLAVVRRRVELFAAAAATSLARYRFTDHVPLDMFVIDDDSGDILGRPLVTVTAEIEGRAGGATLLDCQIDFSLPKARAGVSTARLVSWAGKPPARMSGQRSARRLRAVRRRAASVLNRYGPELTFPEFAASCDGCDRDRPVGRWLRGNPSTLRTGRRALRGASLMGSVATASRRRQSNRGILTRRNSTSITGQFNSVRGDGVLRVFQSLPEFLHLGLLDTHPNVEWFETQPETFELPGNRAYTADALIGFRRGRRPVYREVKPLAMIAADPDLEGRADDIIEACDERDADFEIVVEEYWLNPLRWSIGTNLRHAVRRASRVEMDAVHAQLEGGCASLAEIMQDPRLGAAGRFAALSLCAAGRADFRRDRPITNATVVRLVQGEQ